jgi:hypothetical protein
VATIVYGYPLENMELKNKIKAGEIMLGGGNSSSDRPAWECLDCGYQIRRQFRILDLLTLHITSHVVETN